MLQLIILTTCLTLLFGFIFYILLQNIFSVPYVPTRVRELRKLFAELEIPEGTRMIDLGSGDGTVVLMAARAGAQAQGIEINPILILVSRLRASLSRTPAKFMVGSYFKHDLSQYNLVYTFLLPTHMQKLQPKFVSELPAGSRVVTNYFKLAGMQPEKTIAEHFHVYRIG